VRRSEENTEVNQLRVFLFSQSRSERYPQGRIFTKTNSCDFISYGN